MAVLRTLFLACIGLVPAWSALAENVVVEDDGVGITAGELEYIVSNWSPQMQRSAANDVGDRFELLNMVMVVKKLAREGDNLEPGTEAYYRYKSKIDSEKRKLVLQEFANSLEVPDMTELARERYDSLKDKVALIPEMRSSSHILIACRTGSKCMRPDAEAKAQEVLDQLRAGADFAEMVERYSDDPGTKKKGGKFSRWLSMGDRKVSPPYLGGLFAIEKVGEYSEIVNTQFGVHIIRLDAIKEKSYKPFEEVEDKIVEELETEYRKLALKNYRAQFNLSDKAYIDGDAVEKIFSKYRTAN